MRITAGTTGNGRAPVLQQGGRLIGRRARKCRTYNAKVDSVGLNRFRVNRTPAVQALLRLLTCTRTEVARRPAAPANGRSWPSTCMPLIDRRCPFQAANRVDRLPGATIPHCGEHQGG